MDTESTNIPIIKAKNLHRYLGIKEQCVHALKGINLAINPATTYAISGPSGCGKSTLLYLLGLLDQQDKGEIWIKEKLMNFVPKELKGKKSEDKDSD